MNNSKAHTFQYRITVVFILIASVIVMSQMLVFISAMKTTEDAISHRRLNLYRTIALHGFALHADTVGVLAIDLLTTAYKGYDRLPENIRQHIDPDWLGVQEIFYGQQEDEFMVLAIKDRSIAPEDTFYIIENVTLLEVSDAEGMLWVSGYTTLMIALFVMACFAIIVVARRLTLPLQLLSRQLHNSTTDDLTLLTVPDQAPREIQQLVGSLNDYRQRLEQLIERERSFTSYASHELRTPLTVARGVAGLLDVSTDPVFIERQKQRLIKATEEMNDVIETLLSLARKESHDTIVPLPISKELLEQVVSDHQQLLRGKAVTTHITLVQEPAVPAPEAVVRILLSNLIRNAMACTTEGSVIVHADSNSLKVIDSGCGLDNKASDYRGYGIGLLIVNDICRKYGWQFSLENNIHQPGCTASIVLRPDGESEISP